MTGLLVASAALANRGECSIKNLRNVNPYVGTALEEWRKGGGRVAHAPRELAPSSAAAGGAVAGCSSFGMSGVNAHVLLAAGTLSTVSKVLLIQNLWAVMATIWGVVIEM